MDNFCKKSLRLEINFILPPGRLLHDVVEQEQDAGQPLHGPDEQFTELLMVALGLALRNLEAGLALLALGRRILLLLVEVE